MKKYLAPISLLLMTTFIVIYFFVPQAMDALSSPYNTLLLLIILLGAFITALFSERGRLKIIALSISSLGMLGLVWALIYIIGMILFGNFGT
ncbi:histidine kinase [Halobacillus halophilus]|uniref:histidine kinase n=1 Tax=Halobacillus halophilus TaxID=1570 RepID=UPI001CD4DA54|nr:histidine kinase [Halobacillus halophilus]MCA1011694.1 histidine kinase [Halobacillus halophilus]